MQCDRLMLMVGLSFLTLSFFLSSRRRHTIFVCDWSSDVCSSDLVADDLLDRTAEVDVDEVRLEQLGNHGGGPGHDRSEERRVGKEGRSRMKSCSGFDIQR